MNAALGTTMRDLLRVLPATPANAGLAKHLHKASQDRANQIVADNQNSHPGLKSTVTQTGPLSYSIQFSAPGLWSGVFGTTTKSENGFITSPVNGLRGLS